MRQSVRSQSDPGHVLLDGGELGALMRDFDWASAPVGRPDQWPQPLKTLVDVMLASAQPMFLAWGPERTLLYNDAYATILAGKHPGALGRDILDVWPEIRGDIGPIVSQAYAGQPVRMEDIELVLERRGYPEETHFAFSYTPVRDEAGEVSGFFCACVELTEQVFARRAQAFRLAFEERLRDLGDPDLVMTTAVTMLGEHLGADRVGYGQVQADDETVSLSHCYALRVEPLLGEFPLQSFGPASISRQRAGETEVCPDVLADAGQDARTWAAIETRAFVSVPLLREGRLRGSLYVNTREPRRWSAHEVALIEDVAARTWAALERARAEVVTRQSEAQFRLMADAVPSIVWVTDAEGRAEFFNRQWFEYTGAQSPASAVEASETHVHPDDAASTIDAFNAARSSGSTFLTEHRIRSAAGTYRWFLVRGEPQKDASGAIVRWFGASIDIDDRKRVEEALAESETKLRRLNNTLEAAVAERTAERDRLWNLSEDMLARADYEGMMSAVSPAWTRVLGFSEAELLARPYSDFMHEGDVGVTLDALARMGRTGQPTRFRNRILTSAGTYKPIEWTVAPEPDGANFIAVGRDISVETRRQAELETAQEQLRQSQKLEAVGQLTGGVAHDFNNLLTVIRGSVELLLRPEIPEEKRRRYLAAIADTTDRATKLTGQLLAFARRQSLKPEVFDAGKSVQALADMVRTLTGSQIQLEIAVAADPCFVNADPSQFDTALINFAVNARDAMAGEGRLTIEVKPVSTIPAVRGAPSITGDFVAVSVADTGEGIAADALGQIFEPFFTTKAVGTGTGLGLSQVFGFAKQSGGEVEVRSQPGAGATFTLYLPRANAADRVEGTRLAHRLVDGQGACVLVVEDNAPVGAFSTQALEELGYQTVLTGDANAALAELAKDARRFDIVFTDVVMPGMNGVELAQEIRRLHPGVPVLLASGYSHVLAQDGAHGFELLHKPYSIEELSRLLRKTVAGSRSANPPTA